MTTQTQAAPLAIRDRTTGEIIEVGPSLPAVTVEEAESYFVPAKDTIEALRRYVEYLENVLVDGWKARGQVEGILGGRRYEIRAKKGTYVYREAELFEALAPFVGRVITQEERIEALGWNYIPSQIIPATVTAERVEYDPKTATLDSFCKRGKEIAAVIEAHRTRETGPDRLVAK